MQPTFNFDERPFIVIWETTQACDLACVHCRACAQPLRSALELSTEQAKSLIDEVAALRAPVFVLTGGDPLKGPTSSNSSNTPPTTASASRSRPVRLRSSPAKPSSASRNVVSPASPSVSTVPPPPSTMLSAASPVPSTGLSRPSAGPAKSVCPFRSTPPSRATIFPTSTP